MDMSCFDGLSMTHFLTSNIEYMPELPEVQTQVDDLQALIGRRFVNVKTNTAKQFVPSFAVFHKILKGLKIQKIERRAKYLVFFLEKGKVMVVHFRMTGHFLINVEDPFVRTVFTLDQGFKLNYSDIRKFGKFWLSDRQNYQIVSGLDKLGIEPLSEEFSFQKFQEILKTSKGLLKAFLLNQKYIAGIGNIYADESAFLAGLHPLSKIENLNQKQQKKLYQAIRESLQKGIANRGTTIGEYVDTTGKHGKNQHELLAYKRAEKPCLNCGTKMQRMVVVQRGTTFCKKCQKRV